MLFIDQYGNKFFASSIRNLRSQIGNGGSRVSKMYIDTDDGTYHIGYVIGDHWLTMYAPVTFKA